MAATEDMNLPSREIFHGSIRMSPEGHEDDHPSHPVRGFTHSQQKALHLSFPHHKTTFNEREDPFWI